MILDMNSINIFFHVSNFHEKVTLPFLLKPLPVPGNSLEINLWLKFTATVDGPRGSMKVMIFLVVMMLPWIFSGR